ncbi:hypothetical protein ACVIGB_000515 [Bradyrhizobium sp. USDA 4341]
MLKRSAHVFVIRSLLSFGVFGLAGMVMTITALVLVPTAARAQFGLREIPSKVSPGLHSFGVSGGHFHSWKVQRRAISVPVSSGLSKMTFTRTSAIIPSHEIGADELNIRSSDVGRVFVLAALFGFAAFGDVYDADAQTRVDVRGAVVEAAEPVGIRDPGPLAKANDETPRFYFRTTVRPLTQACSASVTVQANDLSALQSRGIESVEQLQGVIRGLPKLTSAEIGSVRDAIGEPKTPAAFLGALDSWRAKNPASAKKVAPYERFAIEGTPPSGGAICTLGAGGQNAAQARISGGCIAAWGSEGVGPPLSVSFDPGLCLFDVQAVVTAVTSHFRIVPGSNVPERPSCALRLEVFVAKLDDLFSSHPHSIDPLFTLLNEFFPLQRCDPAEAEKIASRSKFFVGVRAENQFRNFGFSSANPSNPRSGFYVGFALDRSGNSRLPFANPNQK